MCSLENLMEKKGNEMKRKRVGIWQNRTWLSFCLVFSILLVNLSGCSFFKEKEPLSISGFAFDTTYTLTLYQGGNQKLLDSCVSLCNKYEKIFSRTSEDSELYQVNLLGQLYLQVWKEENAEKTNKSRKKKKNMYSTIEEKLSAQWKENNLPDKEFYLSEQGILRIAVSDDLGELIEKGLYYSKLSEGGFDITIDPVSRLWDFSSGKGTVPERAVIRQNLELVDYQKLHITGGYVEFERPGMGLDLGGIAKGYIADRLKEYLQENGVTSGMVNLGGNVLCIGRKPDKEQFHIGIQQPFADRNETIAAINAEDVSVVSSGIYERYIEAEDGTLYHHILNPKTGYSYENNLIGVTIVSEKSVDGDGLSTTVFALGLEEGLQLVNSLDGVEAVFITKEEQLCYSEGFQKMLY